MRRTLVVESSHTKAHGLHCAMSDVGTLSLLTVSLVAPEIVRGRLSSGLSAVYKVPFVKPDEVNDDLQSYAINFFPPLAVVTFQPLLLISWGPQILRAVPQPILRGLADWLGCLS